MFDDDNNKLDKNETKENKTKSKIKEYFTINKSLTKNNFNNFLKFIGLGEIWSTEDEQKILWDKVTMYSVDKQNIDYEAALCGINDFFEEEGDEEDIDNISDENNKLSENDNDSLLDIDLQSLHIRSNVLLEEDEKDNKKDNSNEDNCIDEFINNLLNKEEIIYGIRFINEIYFNKHLNENNLEKEVENKKDNDNDSDSIKINKNDIINEIQNKYKFINIPNNELENYFNYISKKNTNSKNNEIIIDKSLIKYINVIIKTKIIDNKDNTNKILIKSLNLNNITNNNSSNNKNISISENIDKLISSDSNIVECIKAIIDKNNNKNFIELAKEYIEKYILNLRNTLYKEIKSKENEYEQKLLGVGNNNNLNNKNIEEENRKLKSQIESLIKENLSLSKDYEELKSKKEIEQSKSINEDEKIKTINENSKNVTPKKISIDILNNTQKNKGKIFIPPLKLKEQINCNIDNSNIISTEQSKEHSNINIINNCSSSSKSKLNISKSPNKLQTVGTNSFNDICTDDLTNSHIDIFSNNLNNITDQFLLDTTRLCNEDDELKNNDEKMFNDNKFEINTKTLNMDENKKKKNNINNYLYSDIPGRISQIKYDDKDEYLENYDDYYDDIELDINKKPRYSKRLTDHNLRYNESENNCLIINDNNNNNINNNKNNNYYKAQSFYGNNINNQLKKKFKYSNEDIFYGYMNKAIKDFYDFKYLFRNHKIQKLFSKNKEKLINNEFLSDQINACFSNLKKKKCLLIITYQSLYFLKNDDTFECLLKLNIKSLESIIISTKNFNLLLLSFNGGTDIIIETFQRIEILRFLQKIIDKGKLIPNLKVSSLNNFVLHKRNGITENVPTLKNKNFIISPNFENAQKIGVLLKYKENFFSASFHEKLIVLTSIGLMYFDENSKFPKDIIPVIGTSIKFIVVQVNKKIYCLKMKTINDEVYIFGSLLKREIFDWLKELAHFKKVYHLKMKQINPNYITSSSKEMSNNINIMNNEINDNIFL